MHRISPASSALLLVVAAMILMLAGCNYVTTFVTLDKTGAGTRTVQAKFDSQLGETSSPTLAQAIRLFGIDPEIGWKEITEQQRSGSQEKPRRIFEHTATMENTDAWKDAAGDLSIRGSLGASGADQLLFSNAVDVSLVRDAGRRTLTYRETFSWIRFLKYYIDYESDRIWQSLHIRYPFLQHDDELEFRGLMAGLLALTTDLETRNDTCDSVDDALERALASTLFEMIRRRSPAVSREELDAFLQKVLDDSSDHFEQRIQQDMPGAYLATQTEIVLKITFPGTLVESNAHSIDGQTASWTIHPLDAIAHPLELFVTAEIID